MSCISDFKQHKHNTVYLTRLLLKLSAIIAYSSLSGHFITLWQFAISSLITLSVHCIKQSVVTLYCLANCLTVVSDPR